MLAEKLLWHMKNRRMQYKQFKRYNKIVVLGPKQVERRKQGTCWDYALYEYAQLKSSYVELGFFYLESSYVPGTKGPYSTHSAIYYKVLNQYYWFEYAWYAEKGIHGPYETLTALETELTKRYAQHLQTLEHGTYTLASIRHDADLLQMDQYTLQDYVNANDYLQILGASFKLGDG